MKYLLFISFSFISVAVFSQNKVVPIWNSMYPENDKLACIYLDFDGYYLDSADRWFATAGYTERFIGASTLSNTEMRHAFNIIAEDYRPFNVNVTTDSTVFYRSPIGKRTRVVITPDYFLNAGGVAWIGSVLWGDDSPCWVFESLLSNNGKYVGDCCAHESGHTFNLTHHHAYDTTSCTYQYEYEYGNVPYDNKSWAPIMGASYYTALGTWDDGGPKSCWPVSKNDDIAILTKIISIKTDDVGNDYANAKDVQMYNDTAVEIKANGIIERSTDKDVFKVSFRRKTNIRILIRSDAVAKNGELGLGASDIDIQVRLGQKTGKTITYNPLASLDVEIDSVFDAGIYYLTVEGGSNPNFQKYGSLGGYEIYGSGTEIIPPNIPPKAHVTDDGATIVFNRTTRDTDFVSVKLNGYGTDDDGTIVSHRWRKISGGGQAFDVSFADSPQAIYTSVNLKAGIYDFELTVTDNGGASGSDTMQLTIEEKRPPVSVNLGGIHNVCLNFGEAYILASGYKAEIPYQFLWSTGDTTADLVVQNSGSYWVKIDSAGVGTGTDTATINLKRRPQFYVPADTAMCLGMPIEIMPRHLMKDSQSSGVYKFVWNIGNDSVVTYSSQNAKIIVRKPGTIKVIGTSNGLCGQISYSINIGVRPYMKRTLKSPPVCDAFIGNDIPVFPQTPPTIFSNMIINGVVNVTMPDEGYSYEIIDIAGQVFAKGRLKMGVNSVNVSHLRTGIYLLKMFDGKEITISKIYKK